MKPVEVKNTNDKLFTELYDLYEEAFPTTERRDKNGFMGKMLHEPRFHCTAFIHDTIFAGFLTYWQFDSFLYVEHFAISEKLRGNNLGGKVLSQFVKETSLPVVLEVEIPDTPIAKRRIAFYERHGFRIVHDDYVQPPYIDGLPSVPMFLMSTAETFTDGQVRELQQAVYGIK